MKQKSIEDVLPNVSCRKQVFDKVKLTKELSFLAIRYQVIKTPLSIYNYQSYKTTASFATYIHGGKITLREAKCRKGILVIDLRKIMDETRPNKK